MNIECDNCRLRLEKNIVWVLQALNGPKNESITEQGERSLKKRPEIYSAKVSDLSGLLRLAKSAFAEKENAKILLVASKRLISFPELDPKSGREKIPENALENRLSQQIDYGQNVLQARIRLSGKVEFAEQTELCPGSESIQKDFSREKLQEWPMVIALLPAISISGAFIDFKAARHALEKRFRPMKVFIGILIDFTPTRLTEQKKLIETEADFLIFPCQLSNKRNLHFQILFSDATINGETLINGGTLNGGTLRESKAEITVTKVEAEDLFGSKTSRNKGNGADELKAENDLSTEKDEDQKTLSVRDRFENELLKLAPDVKFIDREGNERSANVSLFSFESLNSEALAEIADLSARQTKVFSPCAGTIGEEEFSDFQLPFSLRLGAIRLEFEDESEGMENQIKQNEMTEGKEIADWKLLAGKIAAAAETLRKMGRFNSG
jgi:hypothetical protein